MSKTPFEVRDTSDFVPRTVMVRRDEAAAQVRAWLERHPACPDQLAARLTGFPLELIRLVGGRRQGYPR